MSHVLPFTPIRFKYQYQVVILIKTKIPAVGFDPTTSGGVDAPARFLCAMPVFLLITRLLSYMIADVPSVGFDPTTS